MFAQILISADQRPALPVSFQATVPDFSMTCAAVSSTASRCSTVLVF